MDTIDFFHPEELDARDQQIHNWISYLPSVYQKPWDFRIECPICYENCSFAFFRHNPAKFKCGHVFGRSCIEEYFYTNMRANSCPVCRTRLFQDRGRGPVVFENDKYDYNRGFGLWIGIVMTVLAWLMLLVMGDETTTEEPIELRPAFSEETQDFLVRIIKVPLKPTFLTFVIGIMGGMMRQMYFWEPPSMLPTPPLESRKSRHVMLYVHAALMWVLIWVIHSRDAQVSLPLWTQCLLTFMAGEGLVSGLGPPVLGDMFAMMGFVYPAIHILGMMCL